MNPGKIVQGATDVDYVLAISVFLTFVNTTRYLELFPDFYVLINTLLGGLPSVLRFMIGCTPIYLGFATGKFCHGAQVQFPFVTFGVCCLAFQRPRDWYTQERLRTSSL